eukprot:891151-Amphidinium_carterae.1
MAWHCWFLPLQLLGVFTGHVKGAKTNPRGLMFHQALPRKVLTYCTTYAETRSRSLSCCSPVQTGLSAPSARQIQCTINLLCACVLSHCWPVLCLLVFVDNLHLSLILSVQFFVVADVALPCGPKTP